MSDIVREIVEIECAKAAEEAAQKATEEATKENSIKNIKLLIKNGVPLSTIVKATFRKFIQSVKAIPLVNSIEMSYSVYI
mgnify:CR=1 FL=1